MAIALAPLAVELAGPATHRLVVAELTGLARVAAVGRRTGAPLGARHGSIQGRLLRRLLHAHLERQVQQLRLVDLIKVGGPHLHVRHRRQHRHQLLAAHLFEYK